VGLDDDGTDRGLIRMGRRVLGLVFIVVLVALGGIAVGAYEKVFTPVDRVTLLVDHTGNQLAPGADVKIRGVIVGEVRGVHADGTGARVDLAIKPGQLALIPRNSTARLLPKTLFGERYVALVPPMRPAPDSLRPGDTVRQDRSFQAVEVDRVLADLLPVLQAVRPEQLNATLHALSTALAGRGDRLGGTLTTLSQYVGALTPKLPAIRHDLAALASASGTLNDATPDLAAALNDLAVTSSTVTSQRALLADLITSTTRLSKTAEPFLAANETRLIRLSAQSRPVLGALAEYSPEYPCFFQGMAGLVPRGEQAFGGGQPGLRIVISVSRDNGAYRPGEEPKNGLDLGPRCYGLPNRVPVPFPLPDVGRPDGSGHIADGSTGFDGTGTLGRVMTADLGTQGSPAETRAIKALLAPVEGVDNPDQVPDAAALLFAPMLRGAEVGYG
jgi:phospholipid/cholesterol/gamma-HCH transport system substrate-binding protein